MKTLFIEEKEMVIYSLTDLANSLNLTAAGLLYRIQTLKMPAPSIPYGSRLYYSQDVFDKWSKPTAVTVS